MMNVQAKYEVNPMNGFAQKRTKPTRLIRSQETTEIPWNIIKRFGEFRPEYFCLEWSHSNKEFNQKYAETT